MSERSPRRRGVVSGGRKKIKPPTPRSYGNRSSSRSSRSSKVMKRCSSEPMLWSTGLGEDVKQNNLMGAEYGVLFRPQTCTDVFASSPSLLSSSPNRNRGEGYNKDAKVVVNVTVEGSPGPVRTMVKLGASVEETIRIVVEKYAKERRTLKFDRDLATGYELHHSHFSLQSLDKSEVIGDVGSRSFYLRRSCSNHSSGNFPSASADPRTANPSPNAPAIPSPIALFSALIAQKLSKLLRKARKLWRILLCFHCE